MGPRILDLLRVAVPAVWKVHPHVPAESDARDRASKSALHHGGFVHYYGAVQFNAPGEIPPTLYDCCVLCRLHSGSDVSSPAP